MFLSYDGTFEGVLSAMAMCLREQRDVWGILPDSRAMQSLLPTEPVAVEPDILARFDRWLSRRFGSEAMDLLYHAFLSEQDDIELRMLGFLRTGLRIGGDPSDLLQDPHVAAVQAAARAVVRQAHAYTGLLRFRLLGGVYVADFEPDYLVLPLLTQHFADRMRDRPFLIRDRRRCLAAVSAPDHPCFIVAMEPGDVPETPSAHDAPEPSSSDCPGPDGSASFEEIWRSYHAVMAIPQRINPDLQRANMPKKYWKYLVERPGAGTGRIAL